MKGTTHHPARFSPPGTIYPEMLPRTFKIRFDEAPDSSEKRRILADYISGMTDRYVMDLYT
ncbi:hypothetical protein [Syntrophus sp. (in: bacteria)]|uniref:hypothetical protein n=1 Tax=Syntrophus sp. (in: bacteria) TaxID=48412 RepID=UPI00345EB58E